MRTRIENIISQFDELSLRLRLLLTLSVIAVIFMVFDIFLFSSNAQNIKNIQQKILNSRSQIVELVNLQNNYNQKKFAARSDPKTKQLEKINFDLSKTHQRLVEHTTNLVHPKDMSEVLKAILSSTKKLTLQSLLKQESVDLSKNSEPNRTDKNDKHEEQIKLYRHSVEIVLYGDYQSTHNFLKKLETMKKKVTFDNLEYVVDIHPKAYIKLTISTLSLESGWIGG